jgi:hypothetical protein
VTHNPAQGSRGALFFSASQAPGRVLFKAFVNQLCPAAFTRGGQPAGPKLTRTPNPAGSGNALTGTPQGAATGMGPGANAGMISNIGAGGAPLGAGVASTSSGTGAPGMIPGAGMVPGASAGMGVRPNPTPTPPNANHNPAAVPNGSPAGINPGLMQGLNSSGGMPGLNVGGISGINLTGVPGVGATGISGLNPTAVPGVNSGAAPNLNPGGTPGLNPVLSNQAQANLNRIVNQMALARVGITPAQLASATPQQKQIMIMQVQQMIPRIRAQLQQSMAGGVGAGMQPRPPGMPGGQPGLEHLQAFIRQQQQQQQQQHQQRQG